MHYLAIATILLAAILSARSTSADKFTRILEDSQYSFRNEKKISEERDESKQRVLDFRDVDDKLENHSWQESSLEELTAATGPNNDYPGYLVDNRNRFNDNKETNNRQKIDDYLSDAFPGRPGMDYPNYVTVPLTSFTCVNKEPGGYYADVETGCQVFHICNIGGVKSSFLCPSGSIFNQRYSVCDWWYSFNCDEALDLYEKKMQPDSSLSKENQHIYVKISNKIAEAMENIEESENLFPPVAEEGTRDSRIKNKYPTNDLSFANNRSNDSRKSFIEKNEQSMNELENNIRSYLSDDTRTLKNENNRDNSYNMPRGFSRNRDESLRKKIDLDSKDSTNDLASYVNYLYFETKSYTNDHYYNNVAS